MLEKEVLIIRIAQDLDEVRKATRVYLDQKQTLSYDELKKVRKGGDDEIVLFCSSTHCFFKYPVL